MQNEIEATIKYRWWNEEKGVCEQHQNELGNHAINRIREMREEFYTCGELIYEIDNIDYRGWWEYSEKTVQGDEGSK